MNTKRYLPFWTLSLLLLLSCAPSTMDYRPAPDPNLSPKKAKTIIRETILNQPGNYAPQSVLINDEILEIKKITTQGRGRRRSSTTDTTTVTLSSIGNIVFTRATIYYVVTIFDKENSEVYRVYTSLESQAKEFMDALKTVMVQRPSDKQQNGN